MKTTLLILTLNEIDGMKAIAPRIKDEWLDQILVMDGGSTDGTIEYAKKCGYKVLHQKKKGLVNAYRESYEHFTGDIIITFSPDGNSVPDRIPDLISKIKEGFDMVICSRYLGGGKSDDDSLPSRLGNWLFTKLINVLFSAKHTDSLVMFRAYRTPFIKKLGMMENRRLSIEKFFPGLYDWNILSSIRSNKIEMRTAEIFGREPARIGGVSKVRKFRCALVLFALTINEFFFWKVQPNQ